MIFNRDGGNMEVNPGNPNWSSNRPCQPSNPRPLRAQFLYAKYLRSVDSQQRLNGHFPRHVLSKIVVRQGFMGALDIYTDLAAVHLMFCKPVDVVVKDQLSLGIGASVSLRYELFPNQLPSFGVKVRIVNGEVYTTCTKRRRLEQIIDRHDRIKASRTFKGRVTIAQTVGSKYQDPLKVFKLSQKDRHESIPCNIFSVSFL